MSFCPAEADPNYRPLFGGTEASNTSRIPVKSVTASKFERAHKKQFKRQALCCTLGTHTHTSEATQFLFGSVLAGSVLP